MKIIQIFIVQPVKLPHFKSLLTRKQARWPHFFIAWMLITGTPSFKNSLMVEKFKEITLSGIFIYYLYTILGSIGVVCGPVCRL